MATDWGDGIALDPILVPNASPDRVAYVIERGLAHAGEFGFGAVDVVIDRADHAMRETLVRRGFVDEHAEQLEVVAAWMEAAARPPVGPLHEGYRSCSRRDAVAAYALSRFDPDTAAGLVEPMRTDDDHQRRGLARHVLTKDVDLLAAAGAKRIKVCFRPGDEAARTPVSGSCPTSRRRCSSSEVCRRCDGRCVADGPGRRGRRARAEEGAVAVAHS